MSEEEFTSEILFDVRLGSYESFFDHNWSSHFFQASEGTLLYEAAHDLCRDWKGIALSSRMAWLMMHSLETFYEEFNRTNPPFFRRLTRAFGEYVANRSSLSNMRKKELVGIVDELGTKVQHELDHRTSPIQPAKVWAEYLKEEELGWALWSSQRTAYGALYFGYEDYLRRAVGIARNEAHYRAFQKKMFRDHFADIFGEPLTVATIDDPEIDVARLVRHCLTHNGGKPSPELKEKIHKIIVKNDILQVFPEDVRSLFSLLTDRVLKIATAAQSLPKFKI